jgi:2-iminobutanoate/2-iminopropanoate deaminase
MKAIQTEKALAALGLYSQTMVTGRLAFTSGQILLDPKTGQVASGGITEQTE